MTKSQAALAAERLPFNRKERYFTGTVLPGILTGHGFGPLNDFLDLCGLDAAVDPDAAEPDLQFFTEYNFAESVYTEQDQQRWPKRAAGDTPDLVLTGPDWLLVVEAKMYDRPSNAGLSEQLARQRTLIDNWQRVLRLERDRVRHVLLVPQPLVAELHLKAGTVDSVVTWEQVRDRLSGSAAGFWSDVLAHAIAAYPQLVAKQATFLANADAKLSGRDIVCGSRRDGEDYPYKWMGRQSGFKGSYLAKDIDSGEWRTREYEVSAKPDRPNSNWFKVSAFVELLALDADAVAALCTEQQFQ